jgi:hypothetical protein
VPIDASGEMVAPFSLFRWPLFRELFIPTLPIHRHPFLIGHLRISGRRKVRHWRILGVDHKISTGIDETPFSVAHSPRQAIRCKVVGAIEYRRYEKNAVAMSASPLISTQRDVSAFVLVVSMPLKAILGELVGGRGSARQPCPMYARRKTQCWPILEVLRGLETSAGVNVIKSAVIALYGSQASFVKIAGPLEWARNDHFPF